MKSGLSLFLIGSDASIGEKLLLLGVVVVFAGIAYAILPRLGEKKIRGYHEQCELEEEEAEELTEKMAGNIDEGAKK